MFVSSRDVSPLGCLFGCAPRRGAEGEGECRWDIVYGAIAIPRPGSRAPLQLRAFAFSPRRRAHSRSPCRGGESCGVFAAPPDAWASDEVATSPRLHGRAATKSRPAPGCMLSVRSSLRCGTHLMRAIRWFVPIPQTLRLDTVSQRFSC